MTAVPELVAGAPSAPEFVYALGEDQRLELSRQLVDNARREGVLPNQQIVCFRVDGCDPLSNLGRDIETSIFSEKFGNDTQLMQREYGPYDERSTFYIAVNRQHRTEDGRVAPKAVGVLRVIRPDSTQQELVTGGLKSLDDIELKELPVRSAPELAQDTGAESFSQYIDVGTVAVADEAKFGRTRSFVSMVLYRAMYADAIASGGEGMVAMIDVLARKGLRSVLGELALNDMSGSFEYLDSKDTVLVHGRFQEMPAVVAKQRNRLLMLAGRKAIGRCIDGPSDMPEHLRRKPPRSLFQLAVAAHGLKTGFMLDRHMAFRYPTKAA